MPDLVAQGKFHFIYSPVCRYGFNFFLDDSRPRFDAFLGLLCEMNSSASAEFPTEKNYDWKLDLLFECSVGKGEPFVSAII